MSRSEYHESVRSGGQVSQENSGLQDALETAPPKLHHQRRLILRGLLIGLFLGIGIAIRMLLIAMREPPRPVAPVEPSMHVEVRAVQPEDVPVTITGFGEVRALTSVAITPKVAGEIVYVHPRLEVGEVIPGGELLFRIDQRDYLAVQTQAASQVERISAMISLLRRQFEIDKGRLENFRRTLELSREEYERDRRLLEEEDVGSVSLVNMSEINYRKAQDAFDQVEQAIDLYPLRINEAESGLRAAKAAREMADLSLERTEIRAPFNARIQMKQIELGQAVAPGVVALLVADDSVLEISVPIDSRDARNWLPFREAVSESSPNWFSDLEPVSCRVSWTEDPYRHTWTGVLHRVERFDQISRTVTVAIRIENDSATGAEDKLPLVEGMYCRVEIPGRGMRSVYRLPRWAVSFEETVFLADNNRLQRRQVEVARTQGEETFIASGLEPGELVVITRMVNPLPGILLQYELPGQPTRITDVAP